MIDARQFQVQRGYHEEAGEQGTDPGKADRGDSLPQADAAADAAKAEAEAKAKADAEAKAAEDAKKKEEDDKRAAEKAEREKDVKIPKERFDAAVGKERAAREAAEKRAQELQEELAAKATAVDVKKLEGELDALEEALDKALVDNDPAEKKRIRAAMREKQAQITDARVEARSAAATAVAIEQIRYDNIVSSLESDFPFLNPDNEDSYDEELAGDLVDLKKAYEASGLGSAAAIKKAVKTLKPRLDEKKGKRADDAGEKVAAKKAAEEAEAKRRAEAVAKAQEAKGSQPPADPGAAGRVDTKASDIKVGELSDDAFDKLPEAEKKRLRGD